MAVNPGMGWGPTVLTSTAALDVGGRAGGWVVGWLIGWVGA